jgi:threonine dehydratase
VTSSEISRATKQSNRIGHAIAARKIRHPTVRRWTATGAPDTVRAMGEVRKRRVTTKKPTLAAGKGLSLAQYLQKILTSRVYDVAIESPLEPAPRLSGRIGNQVLLKREDAQPVFSFKLRGAYNKLAALSPAERARGVICASAGNHAQGVALGARRLGCKARIVMPVTTPRLKIDAVRVLGAEVVLHGDSYSDAYQHALELQARHGSSFVHPFDDPDVLAGQGTVAMEILRQHQAPIDAVFVAIGGGGLISGVAAYIKAVRPEIRVIGVQTSDSDAMLRSVRAGRRVQLAASACSPTARP